MLTILESRGEKYADLSIHYDRPTLQDVGQLGDFLVNQLDSYYKHIAKHRLNLINLDLEKLGKSLKNNFGKDVKVNATVDPTLIGGMVVKVGSRMIDTTIRAKLNSLQNTMKEVG